MDDLLVCLRDTGTGRWCRVPVGGGTVTRTRIALRMPGVATATAAEDPDGNLVLVEPVS